MNRIHNKIKKEGTHFQKRSRHSLLSFLFGRTTIILILLLILIVLLVIVKMLRKK